MYVSSTQIPIGRDTREPIQSIGPISALSTFWLRTSRDAGANTTQRRSP